MLNQTVMSQGSPSMAVYSHAAALAAGGFQADREEQTSAPVLERPVFERLLFAQCWEDPRMDAESLCMQPGKTALVVTSGGCTALSLALLGPERILAIDLNAAQSHLLRLKIAGAKYLSHSEYLELLGVRASSRRGWLYAQCRTALPRSAMVFWDAHQPLIAAGLLRAGRYERYPAAFGRLLIPIEGRRRVERPPCAPGRFRRPGELRVAQNCAVKREESSLSGSESGSQPVSVFETIRRQTQRLRFTHSRYRQRYRPRWPFESHPTGAVQISPGCKSRE